MGFGFWWLLGILHRYYRGRCNQGPEFRATLTYPCVCCCDRGTRFQIEGLVKTSLTFIGLVIEIITAFENESFVFIGNAQHATMYAFFGISGVIDILMHHGAPFPNSLDYVFTILCFSVEGLLFMFHLHGRSMLDQSVHHLLVYVIWCCTLSTFGEMVLRKNVICSLSRCFFVMLQGTWFIQVGAILYPPFKGMKQWNGGNHDDVMLLTIVFAWHVFFIALFMCITAILIFRIHAKNNPTGTSQSGKYFELDSKQSLDEEDLIESQETEVDEVALEASS